MFMVRAEYSGKAIRGQGFVCAGLLFYNSLHGRIFLDGRKMRWLFKTEPSVYSYQQLVKDKKTMWDGVVENLALKNVRDIEKGDLVFIYHTGDEKAAVGVARALGGAYPNPEKDDPKSAGG